MKSLKRIFITGILSLYFIFSHAQVQATKEQWAGVEKKMIESRAYIFQGTVIRQAKKGYQLTCSIIQITKIYKGSPQIKLGTIKVITQEAPPNSLDAGIGLGKGGSYVIFGMITNSTVFDSIVANNSVTLTADNSILFLGDNSAQWGTAFYKPLDSLYSVFSKNGLSVQEQVAPSDSAKH